MLLAFYLVEIVLYDLKTISCRQRDIWRVVLANISLTITLTLVLCTLFYSVGLFVTNMAGKRAEHVIEIRAYIKGRSLYLA